MFERKNTSNQIEILLDGHALSISVDDEEASRLNVNQIQVFTEENKALVDAAVAVKKQKLFGDIQIPDTYYEKRTSEDETNFYEPWHPHDYQKENVKTMLNRFEGKGVFGEQVGLGKTIEALITAHVMFEKGVIHNAVIVVSNKKNNKTDKSNDAIDMFSQWRGEIENKFHSKATGSPIFQVIECADLKALSNALEKNKGSREYTIYLISAKACAYDIGHINALRRQQENYLANPTPVFTDEELNGFSLNDKICVEYENSLNLNPTRITIGKVERKIGYGKNTLENICQAWQQKLLDYVEEIRNKHFQNLFPSSMGAEKVLEAIKSYDNGKIRIEGADKQIYHPIHNLELKKCKLSLPLVSESLETISTAQSKIELFREKTKADLENGKPLLQLTDRDSSLLDLLIIDEIHKFYEGEDESAMKDTMRDTLAKIQKKYCLLLSATPIHDSLNDVVDLLYILGQTGYGEDYPALKSYFYQVYCGLDDTASLADLAISPEALKRLKGMVNSIFTRDRRTTIEVTPVKKFGFFLPEKECAEIERKETIPDALAKFFATGSGALAEYFANLQNKQLKDFFDNDLNTGSKILIYFSVPDERTKFKDKLSALSSVGESCGKDTFVFYSGEYRNECRLLCAPEIEGLNLQEFNVIVFAQMTTPQREGLLSPEQIEQWIGRIFRLTQKSTCYVFTLGRALYRKNNPKREWEGFLDFYYALLSDAQGLDLYGEGRTDVAFVAPIITAYLQKAAKLKQDEIYPKESKGNTPRLKRTKGKELTGAEEKTFSQIVKYFYENGENFNVEYTHSETGEKKHGELNEEGIKEIFRHFCRVISE